jgi:predicted RNA binding protein YcfA (HicA-like mRNA interferase family)
LPKSPRLTAYEAETLVLKAGFQLLRSEGSHRIYGKDRLRVVIPFHSGKILHPKIIKQVLKAIQADQS